MQPYTTRIPLRTCRIWKLGPYILLAVASLGAGCGLGQKDDVKIQEELEIGRGFMNSLNFNQALDIYRSIYEELDYGHPVWIEAAFGYATSLWHSAPAAENDVVQAESVFNEIIERFPDSDWSRVSRLNIARIRMLRDFSGDVEDPTGAIPLLEGLLQDPTLVRHEALLRLAECYRMQFDDVENIQRAQKILRGWLHDYPENPFAAAMWEQIAWMALLDFGENKTALEAFQRAYELGFSDPTREGELLWRMAELAQATGQPELAASFFGRVVTDAPTSGRAFEAIERIKRLRATVPGMESISVPELNLRFSE